MEEIREEDSELTNIRELFDLWRSYLRLDTAYTTARIVEIACEQGVIGYVNPGFKDLLLRVASMRGKESEISPERLGRWLRRISGRPVKQHRLVKEPAGYGNLTAFRLVEMS
jgi:putative DNA primase/helicase